VISKAAERIKNVKTLQLIAGHANIGTTVKFVHPAQDDLAIALESCDKGTSRTGEKAEVCPKGRQQIPGGKKSLELSPQPAPEADS
jgi:hypothetical protein